VKALAIARKTLLEYLREPLLLGLLFLFPLLLLGFYDIAFGETDQGLAKYLTVWVVDEDAGAATADGGRWRAGPQLVEVLRQMEWEGAPIFEVAVVTDRGAAEIALRERKIALLLTIPVDFTQALSNVAEGGAQRGAPPIISLVGDPNSDSFVFAQSFLDELVRQFGRFMTLEEAALFDLQDIVAAHATLPSNVSYEFIPGTGTISDFDFGVPGIIVFGIMFVMITTAMTMVRENVGGTLRRLQLAPLRAFDLLSGVTLAQMLVAALLIPVTFGVAVAMGFRSNGSLPLAMGIGLLLSLAVVGLGLVVACFARNDSEAANLSSVVGVLMVLLSGAMYPMPDLPLTSVRGQTIQLYDLSPFTHATEAMRRVLVAGDGVESLGYELAGLTLLSIVIFGLGIGLYERLQLRRV
jgi:ABC-2 type transport system permease protein